MSDHTTGVDFDTSSEKTPVDPAFVNPPAENLGSTLDKLSPAEKKLLKDAFTDYEFGNKIYNHISKAKNYEGEDNKSFFAAVKTAVNVEGPLCDLIKKSSKYAAIKAAVDASTIEDVNFTKHIIHDDVFYWMLKYSGMRINAADDALTGETGNSSILNNINAIMENREITAPSKDHPFYNSTINDTNGAEVILNCYFTNDSKTLGKCLNSLRKYSTSSDYDEKTLSVADAVALSGPLEIKVYANRSGEPYAFESFNDWCYRVSNTYKYAIKKEGDDYTIAQRVSDDRAADIAASLNDIYKQTTLIKAVFDRLAQPAAIKLYNSMSARPGSKPISHDQTKINQAWDGIGKWNRLHSNQIVLKQDPVVTGFGSYPNLYLPYFPQTVYSSVRQLGGGIIINPTQSYLTANANYGSKLFKNMFDSLKQSLDAANKHLDQKNIDDINKAIEKLSRLETELAKELNNIEVYVKNLAKTNDNTPAYVNSKDIEEKVRLTYNKYNHNLDNFNKTQKALLEALQKISEFIKTTIH